MREMKLQDLKSKTPAELVAFAEEHQVENASTMRKQELMFAILKQLATQEVDIIGEGVEFGRGLGLKVLEFHFPHWGFTSLGALPVKSENEKTCAV